MASTAAPYTALAEVYDQVMAHVDYDHWSDYVAELIRRFAPSHRTLLELACGTGSLTVRLASAFSGHYIATDASPEMVAVARKKLAGHPNVVLGIADFTNLALTERFGVVVLAYDGINYLTTLPSVKKALVEIQRVTEPDGIFLFDQSTPANSINNQSYFDDRFKGRDYSYTRTSSYSETDRIHTTEFVIQKGKNRMTERHEQRAFTRMEMLEAVRSTEFVVEACFRAFDFESADDSSERIQWVLRKAQSDRKISEA